MSARNPHHCLPSTLAMVGIGCTLNVPASLYRRCACQSPITAGARSALGCSYRTPHRRKI
jgi:hypothetical protein